MECFFPLLGMFFRKERNHLIKDKPLSGIFPFVRKNIPSKGKKSAYHNTAILLVHKPKVEVVK